MVKLGTDFYRQGDVVEVARSLLGKVIFTNAGGLVTGGIITETEAYAGVTDRASHAYHNRRTNRTEIMYAPGGAAYVYLCYGIHHLFNFVTGEAGIPHAVLLRGIDPVAGCRIMEQRSGKKASSKTFTDGPGKATRALGLTVMDNGVDLTGNRIWVEDHGMVLNTSDILTTSRIGVAYAGEDAALPYRFVLSDSRKKKWQKKTS
jgi:DNA-3-methyladenine glycosylase